MANRERSWRKRSLRYKLMAIVLVMTVPLIGMLIYNNFYAIHTVRDQVAESYENTLHLYMSQMDSDLADIDIYMNLLESDLISLGRAQTDDDYYYNKQYFHNKLGKDIVIFDSLTSFFVYSIARNDYMGIYRNDRNSIEMKESIERHVAELIETGSMPASRGVRKWNHIRIGQDSYLVDTVYYGEVVLGGLIHTDSLLQPLQALQVGEKGSILFTDDRGEPISQTNRIWNEDIEIRNEDGYYLSGSRDRYLVVGTSSQKGSFSLVALIPDQHILANLPYLQDMIWVVTILCALVIPFGLYTMRKTFLIPLNQVLTAMKKVRAGQLDSRVEMGVTSNEFIMLGHSFNSMMDEIQTLRINVYEEQLNKQREELQRLQLQVKPHFFLNSLNIIYNLAKVRNFELVQEMAVSLIQYFRFMFRSNTSFVQLSEELEHTCNYLRIQSLRFPGRLTWSVDAPPFLEYTPVPPLIIQSFVENSIKHAVTLDEPIHISISIDFLDQAEGSQMIIRIEDNGSGFPSDVLKVLKAGGSVVNDKGEHTGIWNVQRRLRLLYGERSGIRFGNKSDAGGAVVILVLPTNPDPSG
jgi:Predicted signal transduction protein with a C-terminal ATPase domain